MVKLDKVCVDSMSALSDLRELCHVKLAAKRAGFIDVNEYMEYVNRYKRLRNSLYHAGYLMKGWNDGKV
jgi:hypothetical protein